MKVTVQVITTATSDTPGTSILLHFDSKRYLLGHMSEGSQRAYVGNHIRLGKVSDVFLSGKTEWGYTGGLVGLILTVSDQESGKKGDLQALENAKALPERSEGRKSAELGKQGITIHGGENLMHTLATTRCFVFRGAMRLRINEISPEALREKELASKNPDEPTPWFKDENIVVWPLLLYPEGYTTTSSSLDEEIPHPEPTGRKRSFEDFNKAGNSRRNILKGIVEGMFCSNWTMDTMIPDAISDSTPTSLPSGVPSSQTRNLSTGSPTHSTSPTKKTRPSPPAREVATSTNAPIEEDLDLQLSARAPPPGKQRAPWPASTINALPRSRPSPMVLSYIIHLHPVRGKFLPQKAIELGVKPGRDFGKLTNGHSITTSTGRVVTPAEVMEPPKPGTGIAVCDLPDASYIPDFLSKDEWRDLEKIRETVGCFFWLLGEGIVMDPRIQKFMQHMDHAKHVVSAKDVCGNPISFIGAANAVTRLNFLDEKTFPMITSSPPPDPPTRYIPARPGLLWQIEPKWELQESKLFKRFDPQKALEETDSEFLKQAELAKTSLETFTPEEVPGKDVEIITLGTGSALPSKYRNVSSTLLRVPGVGNILFDCGENTLGQLGRYFGNQLPEALRDLRAVYISHLHADHHLGTVAVLKAWYKEALKSGVKRDDAKWWMNVVAPRKFDIWLREYADVEQFGKDRIRFVGSEEIRHGNFSDRYKSVLKNLSLTSIATAPANHCQGSFTTAWTFTDTFKFAYSGDTRPTASFVEIGKGATVLLHEATFDDELIDEAKIKKHSTTGEALRVADEMGAWGVVLTHFSQRYPKLPVMQFHKGEGRRVVVAFDFLRVRVRDMGRFGSLVEGLRELYKVDEEAEGVDLEAEGVEKEMEEEVKASKKEKKRKEKEKLVN